VDPKDDLMDESAFIISEIESNLEKVLQKRREEVERELQEKIKKEKEESERKKSLIEKEFEKERGAIKEFRGAITEFEAARDSVQQQMRDHLELGMRYQRDIEKMTALTLEELKKVSDLSLQLTELRQTSEKKVAEIKTKMQERFGIVAEVPERKAENEMVADLEHELSKLKKIKELLENESGPAGAAAEVHPVPEPMAEPLAVPEEPSFASPAPFEPEHFDAEQPQAEFRMPEINQFIEDFIKQEGAATKAFPASESRKHETEEKKAPVDERTFQNVMEMLEKYRQAESTDYAGELSYFQNRERIVIDGESLIRALTQNLDSARKIFQKLAQTESPKDQFFLKQELINYQEALRKVLLRGAKMCENKSGSLPRYTSDILNEIILNDLLEKLNVDNWSNQEDFRTFEGFALRLKEAFYRMITPPGPYFKSILEEIEG